MSNAIGDFNEIFLGAMNKVNREIRVSLPAIIDSYDFKTQKANVKVNISQVYDGQAVDIPIIPNVPVIFPNSGGASLTMPVKKGDGCLLIFCDTDIKNWLLGGDGVKPQTTRMHSLTDAVAIIGLGTFTKVRGVENNEDVLLHYADSKIRLKPNGVIDIHNAKEINVKTEKVIINCKTAFVKSEDTVAVECKSASVKAQENIVIECKTANIKATEILNAECKTLTAKVSESASVECQSASIKASGTINTETPNFTQKGNMKIDGNVEVTGTSKLTGNVDSDATIKGNAVKAGNVDLGSHTHSYIDSVGEAAVPTARTTQAPAGGNAVQGGRVGNSIPDVAGDTL